MKNNLDLDQNIQRWLPVFDNYINGVPLYCPVCGGRSLSVTACCGDDLVGYALFLCNHCKKAGHFSRVTFPKRLKGMKHF